MLKLYDGGDRLATHVLDGILVAQPIGALDRIVEMPLPTVFLDVAKRSRNATLRRHGMAPSRKDLGNPGRSPPFFRHSKRPAPPRPPGPDDHEAVCVDKG